MRVRFFPVSIILTALSTVSLKGDVITEWNKLVLNAIRNETTAPPLAARNMAILHAAMFDAVNSVDSSFQPYRVKIIPSEPASADAAAVGAAHQSLVSLYPSQRTVFDGALNRFLESAPSTDSRSAGLTLGQSVAKSILAWRSTDGASTSVTYVPTNKPGAWRRTPPFYRPPDLPQWPNVTPFALKSSSQFRPAGPPALSSSQYSADFNQVKTLGALNSTVRTREQTQIARFWSDFSYTITPAGHWNEVARTVAESQGNTLEQNARLFALLNVAMADAGILCWDAKYAYNSWRPVTAIQQADIDGNPDTTADPNWLPLLTTPSFPEYTSGHSTFSAAAAEILKQFYGSDKISFTIGSDGLPGVFRTFNSFTAAAEESGMSRIYGGIHFLSADLDGLAAGHALGEFIFQNHFVPISDLARRKAKVYGSPDKNAAKAHQPQSR